MVRSNVGGSARAGDERHDHGSVCHCDGDRDRDGSCDAESDASGRRVGELNEIELAVRQRDLRDRGLIETVAQPELG